MYMSTHFPEMYIPEMRDGFLEELISDDNAKTMLHDIVDNFGAEAMLLFLESAADFINPGENGDPLLEKERIARVVATFVEMPTTIPAGERTRAVTQLFKAEWALNPFDQDSVEDFFDQLETSQPDIAEDVSTFYETLISVN